MERQILYFAYGSNMNEARMRQRVPSARRAGTATLHGWQVRERLYADITPFLGGRVEGVVYQMPWAGIEALDRFEGCPAVYHRVGVWVETPEGSAQAVVYVLSPAAADERDGLPYPEWYRAICSAGARAHGLADAFAEPTAGAWMGGWTRPHARISN